MINKVIVLLADGFEEVETVTPITFFRRAGIDVVAASIGDDLTVKGARGVQMTADTMLAEAGGDWDAVVVPGGLQGAQNIASCEKAGALLKSMAAAGKLVCAICASPALVLAPLGLLAGKKFTCYPDMEEKIKENNWPCGEWLQHNTVTDGNIITSRAAGTSGNFAIAIIEKLLDKETAQKIAATVLL